MTNAVDVLVCGPGMESVVYCQPKPITPQTRIEGTPVRIWEDPETLKRYWIADNNAASDYQIAVAIAQMRLEAPWDLNPPYSIPTMVQVNE